ncbi:uncharacterized protein [Procambarus clarkii]|uniref:uncharacterized protein isoform X2 n=1 Tax=Procambarus clarkii TaxID=6728 RepID=UPI00374381FB
MDEMVSQLASGSTPHAHGWYIAPLLLGCIILVHHSRHTHSGHSTHLQQPLAGLYTHSSLWSLVPTVLEMSAEFAEVLMVVAIVFFLLWLILVGPSEDGNVRMYQGQTLARPAQRGPVYTETAPPSNTQLNEESRERYRNRAWELDLHGMYRHEADVAVNSFLRKHSDESRVRIITGRGLHSEKNQPVLKPHVINLISQRGLSYKVVSKGGCIDIYPKAPHLHNMGLSDLDLSLESY